MMLHRCCCNCTSSFLTEHDIGNGGEPRWKCQWCGAVCEEYEVLWQTTDELENNDNADTQIIPDVDFNDGVPF